MSENDALPPSGAEELGRDNSATGPRTLAGKRRASQNARRHGVLACAPSFRSRREKREFEKLRADLEDEFRPASASARLILEDTAYAAFRMRHYAQRFEQAALERHLESARRTPGAQSPMTFPFRITPHQVQRRLDFLKQLRAEVERNNYIPAAFKEPVTRALGEEFWKLLVVYLPSDLTIRHRMTEMFVQFERKQTLEGPKDQVGGRRNFPPPTDEQIEKYAKSDLLAQGEFALRLIDQEREHLTLLLSNVGQFGGEADAGQDPVQLALRYQAAARNDFYRGLKELRLLKDENGPGAAG